MAGVLPTGLGNDQQATQATAFVRQQPWYRQWLVQNGIQEGAGQQVSLNDSQRQSLYNLMLKNGIGLNNKYDEVDQNGQIAEAHHKLRNTLVGAGIGAAALTGLGAAGIGPLSGLLGGASAGTSGAAAGGVGADVAGASALPASGVLAGLPGAGALSGAGAGSGGILGTAGKFLGGDPHNPKSYLGLAGAIGSSLGAAGQGAAQGRILQTELNQGQDRLAQEQYQNQLNAPGKIAGNSVRGDILANAKDFSYGAPTMVGNIPVPTSTGGLRPSIFSDSTRALGARQTAEAATMPGPPSLTPMDEAGAGTSILNTAGAIGSFADLLNPNNYKSKIPYQRPMQGQVA